MYSKYNLVWTDEDGNVDSEVDELVIFNDIDVSDAGTYAGQLTNEFGCVSALNFDVVVYENSDADAGVDADICINDNIQLSAFLHKDINEIYRSKKRDFRPLF